MQNLIWIQNNRNFLWAAVVYTDTPRKTKLFLSSFWIVFFSARKMNSAFQYAWTNRLRLAYLSSYAKQINMQSVNKSIPTSRTPSSTVSFREEAACHVTTSCQVTFIHRSGYGNSSEYKEKTHKYRYKCVYVCVCLAKKKWQNVNKLFLYSASSMGW
jgi:hypothetical protein